MFRQRDHHRTGRPPQHAARIGPPPSNPILTPSLLFLVLPPTLEEFDFDPSPVGAHVQAMLRDHQSSPPLFFPSHTGLSSCVPLFSFPPPSLSQVFGFDPTVPPERVQAMFKDHHSRDQPAAFQFRQLGLAGTDGIVTFFHSKNPRVQSMTAVKPEKLAGRFESQGMPAPVLRLPTFMCGNGHGFVDVLKMDVEGVEFDVCDAWLRMKTPLPFGQILIEFHDRMVTDAKARKGACLRALQRNGFVEVYVSENFQEATYARMAPKG
ncbi:unnamed protein product [Closterium sp. NIES-54]